MKNSILCFFMFMTAYYSGIIYAAPTPEIIILSGALGKEGDKFPAELNAIFEPISINKDAPEIAPSIKLLRIDLTENKEFNIPVTESILDYFAKPDPRVTLKNIHDNLEHSAIISSDFSDKQTTNEQQLQTNKEKYTKEIPTIFEIVETKPTTPTDKQFLSVTELLPELKKQIAKDIAAGNASLNYAIFYKLPTPKSLCEYGTNTDGSCKPKPSCEYGTNADGSCKPEPPCANNPNCIPTACTLNPITTARKPNWYAIIEIGSKGIKPIAVKFKGAKQQPEPEEFNNKFDTLDVTPREEISTPRVVEAVCKTINQFHELYGDLPVYLVGSSSMATVKHRTKLEQAITNAIHLPIEFVNANQEAGYLGRGIWEAERMPRARHCESAVIDIGSGNVKGGFIENCDRNVRRGTNEQFVSFDIQDLGTHAFYTEAQSNVNNKTYSSFIDSAANTREQLELQIETYIRTYPELANNAKRYYLAGGAVWILNTMLCLDCPQYKDREENTNRQEVYTAIKPSDIEEFYNYVTQTGKAVCDPSIENPYLRKDLDGVHKEPWDQRRIEKQQRAIEKVCSKFVAPDELLSAAEILRALKSKLGMNEESHLFFIQDTLYTWSRQYLIDKTTGANP